VIVLHVSANANWNKKNAKKATPVEPYVAGALFKKKYWCPIQPLPDPNMNANPNAQNRIPHRQVSAMHSSMMFETSRVRPKPASNIMKPACMKNTRKAAINTHTVLRGLTMSSAFKRRSGLAEHRGSGLGAEVPGNRPKAQHHGAEPNHLSA